MQLSKFTDYALRILMHLAVSEDQMLTTRQIADIHNAKYNHLAKVTQWLVRENYVTSLRGRAGGLKLARNSRDINIGHIVRDLEGQSALVECLKAEGGSCILAPACGLTSALLKAQNAFYEALEQTTLADLTNTSRMSNMLLQLNTALGLRPKSIKARTASLRRLGSRSICFR